MVNGAGDVTVRGVIDFGFRAPLFEPEPPLAELPEDPPTSVSWGLVLHGALGGEDFRIGLKPRLRVPLGGSWSAEVSAGALFSALEGDTRVSQFGFVSGVSLQRGKSISLRGDLHVVHVDRYEFRRENVPIVRGPGNEVSLYGGVTFRERAAWIVTTAGALTMGALLLLFIASGAGA